MKQLIFSASIFLLCVSANAQFNGKITNASVYRDSLILLNRRDITAMNLPKYKFLYKTENGKVFESPIDKMRCLAPDFPSNMPVAAIHIIPPELIPNGSKGLLAPPLLNRK
jgi:hypothetical protein